MTNEDSENSENCPIPEPKEDNVPDRSEGEGTVTLSHFLVDNNQQHHKWKSGRKRRRKPLLSRQVDTPTRTIHETLSQAPTNTSTQFDTNHNGLPAKSDALHTSVFSHSEAEIVKCNLSDCTFSSNFKGQLVTTELSHLETQKSEASNLQLKKFRCLKCEFGANFNKSLKRHVSMIHGKSESNSVGQCEVQKEEDFQSTIFKCLKCDFVTDMNKDLQIHELQVHIKGEGEKLTEKEVFKCSQCNYVSSVRKKLEKHESKHTEIKDFKCTMCDFESKFRSSLRRHKLIHFKIEALRISLKRKGMSMRRKILKCAKCGFCTRLKRNLIVHELRHSKADIVKDSKTTNFVNCEGNGERNEIGNLIKQKAICSNCQSFSCNCGFDPQVKECFKTYKFKTHTTAKIRESTNSKFPSENDFLNSMPRDSNHLKPNATEDSDATNSFIVEGNVETSDVNIVMKRGNVRTKCKSFNCSKCSFVTLYKSSLNRHETNIHLNTKHDLIKIKPIDGKTKIFKCSFCEYASKLSSNTLKHENIHKRRDSTQIGVQINNSNRICQDIGTKDSTKTLKDDSHTQIKAKSCLKNLAHTSQNLPNQVIGQSHPETLGTRLLCSDSTLMKSQSSKPLINCTSNNLGVLVNTVTAEKYPIKYSNRNQQQSSTEAITQPKIRKLKTAKPQSSNPILKNPSHINLQSSSKCLKINITPPSKDPTVKHEEAAPKPESFNYNPTLGRLKLQKTNMTENKQMSSKRSSPHHSNACFPKCTTLPLQPSQNPSTTEIQLNSNQTSVDNGNGDMYSCPDCSYQTLNKHLAPGHQLIHLKVKRLKCSYCPYKTNLRRNLTQHEWTHRKEKRWKCDQCSYETNYTERFKQHKRVHVTS